MPNWCYQVLTINGNAKQLEDFKAHMGATWAEHDDAPKFSLNDFVPIPQVWGIQDDDEQEKWFNKEGYNLCVEQWGTKWDCKEVEIEDHYDDQVIIKFQTAWSPIEPVIIKIMEMFPKLNIYLSYQDECNCFYGFMMRDAKIKIVEQENYDPPPSCRKELVWQQHRAKCHFPEYISFAWNDYEDEKCDCEECEAN